MIQIPVDLNITACTAQYAPKYYSSNYVVGFTLELRAPTLAQEPSLQPMCFIIRYSTSIGGSPEISWR